MLPLKDSFTTVIYIGSENCSGEEEEEDWGNRTEDKANRVPTTLNLGRRSKCLKVPLGI